MDSKLPIKSEEKMKLFFAFIIDKPRNPLKQGISRNFKPWRKITRQGNFPHPRETESKASQRSTRKEHSLWTLSDERKTRDERSKAKGMKQWELGESIPLHEGKHSTRGLCFARWFKEETKGLVSRAHHAMARWLALGGYAGAYANKVQKSVKFFLWSIICK